MIEPILIGLEPRIREIADAGARFQGKVTALLKADTGSLASDVVTEADLWVQQQLLQLFLENGLEHCSLIAEESDPELLARFAPDSEMQLFVDPIDGTKRFVEGTPYFSTIVSVRQANRQLYSYCYYPRLNWWIRLLGEESFEISGRVPLDLDIPERTVVFTSGTAETDFAEWHAPMSDWDWRKGDSLHPCGSKLLYLSGSVAGYACANPNVYDGLMIYHYARVRRHSLRVAAADKAPVLDMTRWEATSRGLQLSGSRYLCVQRAATA